MAGASLSEGEKDSLISQFVGITGTDSQRSTFFLESSGWDLDAALSTFFETQGQEGPVAQGEEGLVELGEGDFERELRQLQPSFGPREDLSSETERRSPNLLTPAPSTARNQQTAHSTMPGSSKPKFATLGSLKNDERERQGDSDEEGQAFFAGGSDRSGQEILGPPRKKDPEKIVKEMFESAKQHGGQAVDEAASSSRRREQAFVGSGFRLGNESGPSQPIPGASSHQPPDPVDMVLKLWRNGFSVDDGPLRSYEDAANADFLRSIKMGEIPRELLSLARGGEVNLNMEDHRQEEFVETKKSVKAFAGEGHRLGGVAPEITPSTTPITSGISSKKEDEEAAQRELELDQNRPFTSIQIRLVDSSRLVLKINTDQPVARIRQFICRARPAMAATPFILLTTFPNKELDNENATIAEASLQNASIVQRLV